ncbi:hypothetical protein KIW84_024228 [Lathyrus oleraceus]|uniref:YTH domain-containing family protein n=1 Tax=Pisum sativum TaxID=3888 RepID=A0A9D4XJD9_PEA|nr:hypothetical protein KIW84_044920 [Pisum sativum]KAI5427264.1 hypothetical protein KIW84_032611 [Pisum sativum]KAI5438401.1 hypothetical protein KIW84_024228 [Pisum sativum]
MIGPVDFNRSLDYWQQDKWNGCFPLKWHIVKDVPNNVLRHIILLNNENKPVTNKDSELLKESTTLAVKDIENHTLSENGAVAKTGDAPKGAKPVVLESKIVPNGVANGC